MIETVVDDFRNNPGSGKMVFISYSRFDLKAADRLVKKLEDAGLNVWIDREDITAGQTWRVQIVEAIDSCDAFILLLSPHSAVSDNVRKEIDLAQDAGRNIFIALVEPVKLPAEIRYQLTGLQQIDFEKLGFSDGTQRLIDSLNRTFERQKDAKPSITRQAEIIIQGIDIARFGEKKQQLLLDFLAKMAETDKSNLQIVAVRSGSIHILIDMAATTAIKLKTLALNRDERFKQFAISALKLSGNKKFINVNFGTLTFSGTKGGLIQPRTIPGIAFPYLLAIGIAAIIVFLFVLITIFRFDFGNSSTPPKATFSPVIAVPIADVTITPASLPDQSSKPSKATETRYICTVSALRAYMRQGPSINYYLVEYRSLPLGEELLMLARNNSNLWFLFQTADGTEGWLYQKWVNCQFDSLIIPTASSIPPLPPDPPRRDKPDTTSP